MSNFFTTRQAQAKEDEKLDSELQKLLDGTLGYVEGLGP